MGTAAKEAVEWKHGKDVVNLTKDTFDTDVAKLPHFVMFFTPW